MKNNFLFALLLSVFISLGTLTPLNALAKEMNQTIQNSSFINEEDEIFPRKRVDLSNQHLTNEMLYKKLEEYGPEKIFELNISSNKLSGELNLEKLENLNYLDCSHNKITDLKIDGSAYWLRINCADNQISQLNVPDTVKTTDQEIEKYDMSSRFNVINDYSNQNVYIHAKKGANVISIQDNFPGIQPAKMNITSGGIKSPNTNQILNVNGDQLKYTYQMFSDKEVDDRYCLDVTVHIQRDGDSSSFTNDPINIAQDVANGLVGRQDSSDPISIHRLYNPNSGEHFYTSNIEERNYLVHVGWKSEGVGWVAPSISMAPVYRLYNPNAGDHHYTMDVNERNTLQSYGWKYESINFYSDEYQTIPLYRQYNPNAISVAHNYTTDQRENDYLVSVGWKPEKIAWYALSK